MGSGRFVVLDWWRAWRKGSSIWLQNLKGLGPSGRTREAWAAAETVSPSSRTGSVWVAAALWLPSHVQLFAALWTVARQALLSMRFSSAMGFPGGDSGFKKKSAASAGGKRRGDPKVPSHALGAVTRSPSPLAWRPDFPGAPREAH